MPGGGGGTPIMFSKLKMLCFYALVLFYLISQIHCAEDYYKLLNLDRSASERDIKKAYRTLSKKYHPDKNPGNNSAHEKFVQIADAYDALSSPETRRIYDQYGHEGLAQHRQGNGGGGRSHDPFDLFSRFFGGGGHFGHGGGERRGPDMEVRVSVPLRDFYTGYEHRITVEKQHICEACEGSGSADGAVDTCGQCGGRGVVVQKHMLAPGIYQQVQAQCGKCGGKGKTIKRPCPVCGGNRVVRQAETHTLNVEKGMEKGTRIVIENEADESPDWVAGDLVVNLAEQEPALGESDGERTDGTFFRRKGRNLFWKEVLSLREAWLGDWSRNLTHLDGHVVRLGRPRGATVQPGQVEILPGEGMPVWLQDMERAGKGGEEQEYGALVVEYAVVIPDQMEKGMEKEFWTVWEKWRRKKGVDLEKELGRPQGGKGGKGGKKTKDEL